MLSIRPKTKPSESYKLKTNKSFTFPEAKTEDINEIINSLNPKKATGPDMVYLLN